MKRKHHISPFQGRIEFGAHQRGSVMSIEHPVEHHVRSALVGSVVILVCAYVYFVAASAFAVIGNNDATRQASKLETAVGVLEGQYLELSKTVTPDRAALLGLIPVAHVSYVNRPGEGSVAYVNNNAI